MFRPWALDGTVLLLLGLRLLCVLFVFSWSLMELAMFCL